MADDRDPIDPEEWCPPILSVVQGSDDPIEIDLGARPQDLSPDQSRDEFGDRLIELEEDIPDEAIHDDDITRSREDVPALDIPYEVERTSIEEVICRDRQLVTLPWLFTNIEEPYSWVGSAEDLTGIYRPQVREL